VAKKETTVSKIAEKAGLSQSFVCRVLKGSRKPSMDNLEKIAGAMGMTTDALIKELRVRASGCK
jgi:transcriptional regulator with XRE-family HTH domain